MRPSSRPAADVTIELRLVRCLLAEQCPDLASLSLVAAGEGWDSCLFRLGDALAVRLPRRAASAVLIAKEQRWLPELRGNEAAGASTPSARAIEER
jgi:aminoglycoside phosphotransferase (APT) family kinase protein